MATWPGSLLYKINVLKQLEGKHHGNDALKLKFMSKKSGSSNDLIVQFFSEITFKDVLMP